MTPPEGQVGGVKGEGGATALRSSDVYLFHRKPPPLRNNEFVKPTLTYLSRTVQTPFNTGNEYPFYTLPSL